MRTTILLLAALLVGNTSSRGAAQPAGPAGCPPERVEPVSSPASRAAVRAGRPFTVVAFGSSSTEGVGASAPDRTYPALLEARLQKALPGEAIRVLNRGIGGQEVGEMVDRLDTDVLAEHPQLVVWQVGSNAALHGTDPETFRDRLVAGLQRLRAAGVDVVIMDSQLSPAVMSRPLQPQIAARLREAATAASVPVFSRTALMRAWEADGVPPLDMLGPDGLHHNDRGYACLAEALAGAILDGLQAAAPVTASKR